GIFGFFSARTAGRSAVYFSGAAPQLPNATGSGSPRTKQRSAANPPLTEGALPIFKDAFPLSSMQNVSPSAHKKRTYRPSRTGESPAMRGVTVSSFPSRSAYTTPESGEPSA